MDLSLIITIALIFLFTLVGAYLRSRARDRCLKAWEGFHVTLEYASGKLVWGVMRLEPTGMELGYLDSIQDERHIESSYLVYANEYAEIQAIYRYADKLSEWGKKRRERDVERSFHPGPLRRFGRALRNFLSTATDSLNEVFSLLLGRVQKTGGRYIAADGSAALKNLGGKVLGHVGSVYDPLLERYIGGRVVVELVEDAEVHEHVGIFKDYSADFLEILDVQYPQRQTVALEAEGMYRSDQIVITAQGEILCVTNNDSRPILINSLLCADDERMINAVVDGGETIELHLGERAPEQVKVNLRMVRELDMIVPRSRALVRHRAEHYRPEDLGDVIFDIVFDVGKIFSDGAGRDTSEARLRQEVHRNPKDALAAANLGFLLIQKDELVEAEKWLRAAQRLEYSLPDGGRRVRMQLREIEHRRQETGRYIPGAIQPAAPALDDIATDI